MPQSITNVEVPSSEHTARRMRRYLISMGIRMAGLVGAVMTEGWVRWVCIALAVVLPYVAVVLGSESVSRGEQATPYQEQRPELTAVPSGPATTGAPTAGPTTAVPTTTGPTTAGPTTTGPAPTGPFAAGLSTIEQRAP